MRRKFSTDYWQQTAAKRQGFTRPELDRTGLKKSPARSDQNSSGQTSTVKVQTKLLFILAMLWVARNTILIRKRPGDMYTAMDTMALLQVGIVLAILAILLLGPGLNLWAQIKKTSIIFYIIYYVLAVFSAVWSLSPGFSFYRALEVLALSMAVLHFCTSGINVEENLKRVRLVVWCTVLMLILGTAHHLSISNLRNNTLGAAAAMTASFFITWILAGRAQKDRKRLIQGVVGVVIVLLSFSLASWWAFWFGICYCSLFSRRKAHIVGLFIIGLLIFFLLGTDTRENLLVRDKTSDQIGSMTGRKTLWVDYWAASMDSPLIGFGFSVGAREVGTRHTTNTHNMFFGALLGLGWVGVACWILFFFALGAELLKYRHSSNPAWLACAAALAAGSMNSMSLSVLSEQWSASTTVFVAFLGLHMSFIQEVKQKNQERTDLSHEIKVSRLWSGKRRPDFYNHPIR